MPPLPADIDPQQLPNLADLGLVAPEADSRGVLAYHGGETAGIARLDEYIWQHDRLRIYKETQKNQLDGGYRYVGFITPDINGKNGIHKFIPKLGTIENMERIIADNHIHQVVIAMERSEQTLLERDCSYRTKMGKANNFILKR